MLTYDDNFQPILGREYRHLKNPSEVLWVAKDQQYDTDIGAESMERLFEYLLFVYPNNDHGIGKLNLLLTTEPRSCSGRVYVS